MAAGASRAAVAGGGTNSNSQCGKIPNSSAATFGGTPPSTAERPRTYSERDNKPTTTTTTTKTGDVIILPPSTCTTGRIRFAVMVVPFRPGKRNSVTKPASRHLDNLGNHSPKTATTSRNVTGQARRHPQPPTGPTGPPLNAEPAPARPHPGSDPASPATARSPRPPAHRSPPPAEPAEPAHPTPAAHPRPHSAAPATPRRTEHSPLRHLRTEGGSAALQLTRS